MKKKKKVDWTRLTWNDEESSQKQKGVEREQTALHGHVIRWVKTRAGQVKTFETVTRLPHPARKALQTPHNHERPHKMKASPLYLTEKWTKSLRIILLTKLSMRTFLISCRSKFQSWYWRLQCTREQLSSLSWFVIILQYMIWFVRERL